MLKVNSCNSLGTRTLPVNNQPTSPQSERTVNYNCQESSGSSRVTELEKLPANFSDVSIFGDIDSKIDEGGHVFQCTLAIIKPEISHLMYKVENILQQNEFIIKTV